MGRRYPDIDDYFGVGQVEAMLRETGRSMLPHLAVMVAASSAAHLNSFLLTDILSHGRACALMNPYYVVFFAPAIEDRLRKVGAIYRKAGYITEKLDDLQGKALGMAVAGGIIRLSKDIGVPLTLTDVEGFTDAHIDRCLTAAKNPKLDSKLKNMPVPLFTDVSKVLYHVFRQ